eukprot:443070-Rhodomonas_salina.1
MMLGYDSIPVLPYPRMLRCFYPIVLNPMMLLRLLLRYYASMLGYSAMAQGYNAMGLTMMLGYDSILVGPYPARIMVALAMILSCDGLMLWM